MRSILVAVSMCAVVSGCAMHSDAWVYANSVCREKYVREIPPQYVQQLVQRTKRIEVPDGRIYCSGKRCTQGTRPEYIPYTEVETVDLNENQRDDLIDSCTVTSCYRSFGNSQCEAAAVTASRQPR